MKERYDTPKPLGSEQGCGPNLRIEWATKPLRQQVFERVRAAGHIPRIDVAKDLHISPGSVTSITADLMAAGMLREVETRSDVATRGRPPVALSIVPEAAYVVGLKLNEFSHSAVVVDFSGTPVAEIDTKRQPSKSDGATLVSEADRLLSDVLAAADLTRAEIRAVGLGVSGIVDHKTGRVPWSPLLHERDVDLGNMMSEKMGLPVHVDNDANMLTLAELWFGAGRDKSSFVVVTIEYGVGMGLVLDNQLYRGALGLGMELGHTKVDLDGALCRCGNRGCLEAYVADYALVREARIALDMNPDARAKVGAMLETLYDQAKAGNHQARSIFKRAGRYLSAGLSNVVHLFDPELIILSGDRMRYDYLYADEVIAEMGRQLLDKGRPPTQVDVSVWGGFVWARGAAALALSAVTDEIFGTQWAEG